MWKISFEPERSLLILRLTEHVGPIQMREVAHAYMRALESTGGESFHVLIDARGLVPLEPEALALFADTKRVTAGMAGFIKCAVLTDSPTIVMQQHRTRVGPARELITMDETEIERFLLAPLT